MKEALEQLYGEYMQLLEQSYDYLIKSEYSMRMKAIERILQPMPYNAENPAISREPIIDDVFQEEEEKKFSVNIPKKVWNPTNRKDL